MGRWIVILLAVSAVMWGIWLWFPGIASVAFVARGFPVRWSMLVFPCLCYVGHRLTGK